MNVFILSTGRSGTTTFIEACASITNYTAGHETRLEAIGPDRLDYPKNHIEADNRLTWLLGRLDARYGDDAIYVHLKRDVDATARSFEKRSQFGIMRAYVEGVHLLRGPLYSALSPDEAASLKYLAAVDYCDTVNANIEHFLKDKSTKMAIDLETAAEQFPEFCRLIGAEADVARGQRAFSTRHNASPQRNDDPERSPLQACSKRIAARVRRSVAAVRHLRAGRT